MKGSFFRIIYLSFSLLLFCLPVYSQQNTGILKGRVLEQSTGKPLENANVFISGTTWGTATDKLGNFLINNIPAGSHDLVASIIGYASQTKSIELKSGETKQIIFNLSEINYELQSVEVSGETPDKWRNNLKIFKERFLGNSEFSKQCIIENPEYINFSWSTKFDLTANCNVPIIVDNSALGYRINCILVDFEWNTMTRNLKLVVMPSFSEMNDSTGELKYIWQRNRKKAFSGSLDHFLKSVIKDSISESGFQVYQDNGAGIEKTHLSHAVEPLATKEDNNYIFSFTDYLKVVYLLNDPSHPEVSWLKLNFMQATLDSNGFPHEKLPFQIFGYWAEKGIADMLPKNYSLQ